MDAMLRASLFIGLCCLATAPIEAAPQPPAPPPADVRAFGARGDGAADDTDAVRGAVASGAGTVRFPRGSYRLRETIEIDLDKTGFVSLHGDGVARVVMAGPGPAFRFVGTHRGSADPEQFKPEVWERQRMPGVDGLEIVGAHPDADGIEAAGTMQLVVGRALLRELRHGIRLATRNRNVLIAESHIYHNRGAGIFYDAVDLHQSNIVGCHISYCAGGGVVARGGSVRNIQVAGCDIECNMTPEGPPAANVHIESADGSIAEVAITGCTIQHSGLAPDSANIRVLGPDPAAARPGAPAGTRWGHVTVAGNVIGDARVNIHLRDCRGVVLTGNTVWLGFDHDLLIERSSHVIVGAHSLDRNPPYDRGRNAAARCGIELREAEDCTLDGLHVNGVRGKDAAVRFVDCRRIQMTDCTVLDSDGIGLLLEHVRDSRIAGCTVRDDRPRQSADPGAVAPSIRVRGGRGNWILHNRFAQGAEIEPGNARVEGNWTGPATD